MFEQIIVLLFGFYVLISLAIYFRLKEKNNILEEKRGQIATAEDIPDGNYIVVAVLMDYFFILYRKRNYFICHSPGSFLPQDEVEIIGNDMKFFRRL